MLSKNYFGTGVTFTNQEKQILEPVYDGAEKLFFCGYPISEYLDPEKKVFQRLQDYLGEGLSFELAALMMLLLGDCPTANLQHSLFYGHIRHAWVSFKLGGRYFAADPSWCLPAILPEREYIRLYPKKQTLWECGRKEFWELPETIQLYRWIRKEDTSDVFNSLEVYNPLYYSSCQESEADKQFGFSCSREGHPSIIDNSLPHYRDEGHRLISNDIIRDFVTNPLALAPRKETVIEALRNVQALDSV